MLLVLDEAHNVCSPELSGAFGFVPARLFARAPTCEQGEALLAGRFAPTNGVVRVGAATRTRAALTGACRFAAERSTLTT